MALWQHDITGDRFDDGATLRPGEDGFTREMAQAHFGADAPFSYIGTPNWAPIESVVEPEAEGSF